MSNRKRPRLGDNSLDLPFEPIPGGGAQVPVGDALLAGGLVVAAASVPIDGHNYPALMFRFSDPTGRFHRPMLLILDDDQLGKLGPVVAQAAESAINAAGGA